MWVSWFFGWRRPTSILNKHGVCCGSTLTPSSGSVGTPAADVCSQMENASCRSWQRYSGGKSKSLCGNDKGVRIKEYNLCAQWNPSAKGTHWTSKCTRFDANGSRKESIRPCGGAGSGGDGKPCYNNLLSMNMKKQTKNIKRLKKKYKHQKKHSKRGRSYDSSNSSSSSSSCSE